MICEYFLKLQKLKKYKIGLLLEIELVDFKT